VEERDKNCPGEDRQQGDHKRSGMSCSTGAPFRKAPKKGCTVHKYLSRSVQHLFFMDAEGPPGIDDPSASQKRNACYWPPGVFSPDFFSSDFFSSDFFSSDFFSSDFFSPVFFSSDFFESGVAFSVFFSPTFGF